jgi:hypothetical protein
MKTHRALSRSAVSRRAVLVAPCSGPDALHHSFVQQLTQADGGIAVMTAGEASSAALGAGDKVAILLPALSHATEDARARHGVSAMEALRFAFYELALASDIAARTDSLVVPAAALHDDRAETLQRLASHFGRPELRLPPLGEPIPPDDGGDGDGEKALQLFCHLPPAEGATAWWDRSLLSAGDAPGAPCPAVIDITGAARILCFGPYLHLPAGRWSAELHLDLCPDAARRHYFTQFGPSDRLSAIMARPAGPGHCVVRLETELAAPTVVETRLSIPRAAFHGELKVLGVKVGKEPSY